MPARILSLFARRPHPGDGTEPVPPEALDGAPPPPVDAPPRAPHPGQLRRERRALARQREIEIRDVGGLAVEMARRDHFRPDLLLARCAEVLGIEQRMQELDAFLATTELAPRGLRGMQTCTCGAPLPRGAHFCSHCGRPTTDTPPVAVCGHCGNPLPADVNFCAVCGNAVAADAYAPVEETFVAPPRHPDEEPGRA